MAKIDFPSVKDRFKKYMFEKGERVGLILCAAIAFVVVAYGIWGGLTSSRPKEGDSWPKVLKSKAEQVQNNIKAAVLDPAIEKAPSLFLASLTEKSPWHIVLSDFVAGDLIAHTELADTKRRNPVVLPVLGEKQIQIGYLRGGILAYEIDVRGQKAYKHKGQTKGPVKGGPITGPGASGAGLITLFKPQRVVVVHAVFPLKEQLEEYRKALRLPTLQDLVAKAEDIPKPVGLNVYRCEILPDGKATDWEYLYRYNTETEKVEVAERFDRLMRESQLDTETGKPFAQYLRNGLATPLPKLGNATYPKATFETIPGDFPEDEKPDPKVQKPDGPKVPTIGKGAEKGGIKGGGTTTGESLGKEPVRWKDLPTALAEKFAGNYDIFDPIVELRKGGVENKQGLGGLIGLPPRGGKVVGQEPKDPKKKEKAAVDIPDALVRFFDIDVEPGKVYRYCVQVRMHNPNFGLKEGVAFQSMTEIKDLYSPFTVTPEIAIPGEYHFYAVDQRPQSDISGGSDWHPSPDKDKTAVQVHRWIRDVSYNGFDKVIGDWAIGERLYVRRGDFIGRNEVFVEVPTWSDTKEDFEIALIPRKVKSADRRAIGVPVDFQGAPPAVPPSLLVDFSGGKQTRDDAAMEILVLTPDGKLLVRNSRIDFEDDNPEGKARKDRYTAWVERINQLHRGSSGGTGPVMPGIGPNKEKQP